MTLGLGNARIEEQQAKGFKPSKAAGSAGLEGFANSPLAGEGEEGGSGGESDDDEDEGVEMRVLLR